MGVHVAATETTFVVAIDLAVLKGPILDDGNTSVKALKITKYRRLELLLSVRLQGIGRSPTCI